jgi:hypothetical protein
MKEEQIRTALRNFIDKTKDNTDTLLATVKSTTADYCTLVDDETGIEYEDVRLRVVLDDKKGFALVPKVGTWALAVRIEGSEDWFVIGVGEVSECILSAERVRITCDDIQFNGGTLGGLFEKAKLTAELNKEKAITQAMISIISGPTVFETGNGAPSSLQLALAAALAGKQLPDYSNVVNDKIKQ